MLRILGIILMLAGIMIGMIGIYAPMENMGTVGTIDGETWVRYSMQASGYGAMALGFLVMVKPNKRRSRR